MAKDKARPFTVFAGDISTTALGTVFMVNTLEPRKVQVLLYEGKVMIRSASEKIAMQDVYLKAGEQFEIIKCWGLFVCRRLQTATTWLPIKGQTAKEYK